MIKRVLLNNLSFTNELIYAENISFALTSKIGKSAARELSDELGKGTLTRKISLKEIIKSFSLVNERPSAQVVKNY